MAFAWMPACCEVFGNLRGIFFRFLNVDFRFLVHFSLFKCKIKSFRSVKGHQVSSKCAQRAHLFLFVSIPLVFYLCFDCVQPLHHFLQGSRGVGDVWRYSRRRAALSGGPARPQYSQQTGMSQSVLWPAVSASPAHMTKHTHRNTQTCITCMLRCWLCLKYQL